MSVMLLPVGKSLYAAAGMFWSMFWALVLGFGLSGVIIAFVPKRRFIRLLGKPGPKELGLAISLGVVSSSCSYAAAAMSRNLFKKGAHIIPALAFLLASTNLVIELSAVLWIMLGWQFVAAEFLGGIILVFLMAVLMRLFAPLDAFEIKQREYAERSEDQEVLSDPRTLDGWRAVARAFLVEWQMLWKDIALGVVIAGVLMVLVPDHFWQSLFLQDTGTSAGGINVFQLVENAMLGPIVSVLSFVCSVGNIPLAAVLFHGGISFGGAISFIYADLIIIPLILIYRKDYGWRLALWITGIFYASMVGAGIIVDLLFHALDWIPARHVMGEMEGMHLFEINYTFWLNLAFLGVAVLLVWLAKSGPESGSTSKECCHEK